MSQKKEEKKTNEKTLSAHPLKTDEILKALIDVKLPDKLQAGDVVFLKKYGCKATVRKVRKQGILCDWFLNGKHYRKILSNDLTSW